MFVLISFIVFLFLGPICPHASSFEFPYASRPITFLTNKGNKLSQHFVSFANTNSINSNIRDEKQRKIQLPIQLVFSKIQNMQSLRIGIVTVALGWLIKVIRPAFYKNMYQVVLALVQSCDKIVTEWYWATVVGITSLIPIYTFLKYFENDAILSIDKLSFAIKNAEIRRSRSDHFIPRPKIGEIINKALTYTLLKNGRYTIVYGPKGIGKTELVDHMAIGKKGVVKLQVSSTNTKDE